MRNHLYVQRIDQVTRFSNGIRRRTFVQKSKAHGSRTRTVCMPRKLRQLRSDPRRYGWELVRETGSHETWQHRELPGISVTLSGGDGEDAKMYQERDVSRAIEALRKGHTK